MPWDNPELKPKGKTIEVETPIVITPFPGQSLRVSEPLEGHELSHRRIVFDEGDAATWLLENKGVNRRFFGHEFFDTVRIAKGAILGQRIDWFSQPVGSTDVVRGTQSRFIKTDDLTNNPCGNQLPRGYLFIVERIEFEFMGEHEDWTDGLAAHSVVRLKVGSRIWEDTTMDRCYPYRLEIARLIDPMRGFFLTVDVRFPNAAETDLTIRARLCGILGSSIC